MNTLVNTSSGSTDPSAKKKYYITQETPALLRRFANNVGEDSPELNANINTIANYYRDEMLTILKESLQDIEILFFSEVEINNGLKEIIQEELRRNQDLEVICLDRFLLQEAKFRVNRFEITRLADGTKDARPGSPAIDLQLDELEATIKNKKILLVDDGLFTGGSVRDAINMLSERGFIIEKVIAYVRDPQQAPTEIDGVPINACLEMRDLKDWIDFRDFLTFCGRNYPKTAEDKFYTTQYYLAPSDDGRKASLDLLPPINFFEFSRRALEIEDTTLGLLETKILGRPLFVEDVTDKGFAIPRFPNINLPNTSGQYREYILRARKVIDAMLLPKPEKVILDMDGTFYPLDGYEDSFNGSTLEKNITVEAILFIMMKEGCDEITAFDIFNLAKEDAIGVSRFLAERYSCSREEYFDNTWGKVDTELVVQPSMQIQQFLDDLIGKTNGLILLTSAPNIWMQKVMQKLGINPFNYFEKIFTAENFQSKTEVFTKIAADYPQQTIISAGDTFLSDIEPAEKAGLMGFLVDRSNPISNLLYAGTLE